MTGCGCLAVLALLIALFVIVIRGSFDAGEPLETAVALAVVFALGRGRRKWAAHQLVGTRRA